MSFHSPKHNFGKSNGALKLLSLAVIAVLLLGIIGAVVMVALGIQDISGVESATVNLPVDNSILRE